MKNRDALPKWARKEIEDLELALARKSQEIANLRGAHAVLFDYQGWTTLKNQGDPTWTLFSLSSEGAHPVVSLGAKDILLVGRGRE